MARKKDILVDQRIQVIGLDFFSDKSVEFIDHSEQGVEFVEIGVAVNADEFTQKDFTDFFITNIGSGQQVEFSSESGTQIAQALVFGVERQALADSKKDFNTITDFAVGGISLDEFIVDLNIGGFQESLEEDDNGNQEFLFPIHDTQADVTIIGIVQTEIFGVEIISHTLHLDDVASEGGVLLFDTGSHEGDRVVLFGSDEHSDEFFQTINDEISSKFVAIFVLFDEFFVGELGQMAERASNHDRNIGQVHFNSFDGTIVNGSCDGSK